MAKRCSSTNSEPSSPKSAPLAGSGDTGRHLGPAGRAPHRHEMRHRDADPDPVLHRPPVPAAEEGPPAGSANQNYDGGRVAGRDLATGSSHRDKSLRAWRRAASTDARSAL